MKNILIIPSLLLSFSSYAGYKCYFEFVTSTGNNHITTYEDTLHMAYGMGQLFIGHAGGEMTYAKCTQY